MSSTSSATTQLKQERHDLLYQIGLPGTEGDSSAVGALSSGDRAYLRDLLGTPIAHWDRGLSSFAATPVLDLLNRSEAGAQRLLASDIALLTSVLASGQDEVRENAFGLRDAAFPIQMGGRIVFCGWVRNYRHHPFSDVECQAIADAAGVPLAEARAAAEASSLLTAEQEEQLLDLARTARDTVRDALEQHLQREHLANQLLQSERTRALGTLSSGVAHRFNNLLSIILGYSSFVLNREDVSQEAASALRKITDAAQQGRRLTEEILAFAGSEVEQPTPCPVHGMLTSILSLLLSQHSSKVNAHTQLEAAEDTVFAPPSTIHQLVYNLLTNAIESMPEGGDLRIRSTNLAESRDGRTVPCLVLTIADTGGIAPLDVDDLDEDIPGAGGSLKLNQVHGIAGSLDGSVTISAEPGEETRVEVRLPVSSASPQAPDTPAPTPARQPAATTVWVVDDDRIFREMCLQVLSDEGHDVALLEDGRRMQDRWTDTAPGLIPKLMIIDFSMPEYNGLELCSWLRDQGSDVPVILVSGFSETQPDIHEALQLSKIHFLRKPFSFRELVDMVTMALGESLIDES